MEDIEEKDKFLDADDLLKDIQEDINHLYRSIISSKIKAAIRSLSTKKSLCPNVFTAEFYQTFKKS
jgi:hypothetical protein